MEQKINTTLISRFMLQLNYQKHIQIPASASPGKARHLLERPCGGLWNHLPLGVPAVRLISSEELFGEGHSPPGLIDPAGVGRRPSQGRFIPCLQGNKDGQRVLALAVSQVILIRNRQYATLVYFGVSAQSPIQSHFVAL